MGATTFVETNLMEWLFSGCGQQYVAARSTQYIGRRTHVHLLLKIVLISRCHSCMEASAGSQLLYIIAQKIDDDTIFRLNTPNLQLNWTRHKSYACAPLRKPQTLDHLSEWVCHISAWPPMERFQ